MTQKLHKKPCNCETCEKARYWEPCSGCKDGHPSFWKTIIESPQWEVWEKEQARRMALFAKTGKTKNYGIYDMPEVMECGWISQKHFQDFLKFIK